MEWRSLSVSFKRFKPIPRRSSKTFISALRSAASLAVEFPESMVLIGARAGYPEVEYGWIEPGRAVSRRAAVEAFRVRRFREKPDPAEAQELFRSGCLWNTFVTAGSKFDPTISQGTG
jgi:mannose-1-phosphate guanylyltransferase